MTFQQWINRACGGKPAVALRKIVETTGEALDYGRVYRWYTRPAAIPPRLARLIETASEGACSFDELTDVDAVAERFEYSDTAAATARLKARFEARSRELQRLLTQRDRLGKQCTKAAADVASLQKQLQALSKRAKRKRAA
jgi:hypothetical protein